MRHVRSWLGMPISTCIKELLTLPKNRGGFGIHLHLHLYKKLSLVKRSALRNSARPEIRQVWTDTSAKNIATDSLLCSSDGLSEAKKSLKSSLILQAESHLHSLVLQGQAIQTTVDCVPKSGIEQWSRVVEALPDFLFRFVKKALQQQLPTASNLARWKRIPSPDCMLCKKSIHQTNKHLLSNCESLLECYSERHNKILELVGSIQTNLRNSAWRSISHFRHSFILTRSSSRRSDRISYCTIDPASQSWNSQSATRRTC